MQDIANAAGVGKATVSLALRDDPRLRASTRQHIQKVAEDMGYKANAVVANLMAQLRASKIPKFQATLGLVNASPRKSILKDVKTFREWVKGCKHRAEEIGYGFDEFQLNDPDVTPARLVKILESRNIRGLIIAALHDYGRLPVEFSELWKRFACVVLGVQTIQPRFNFACNDQFSTAYHAVSEVFCLGYARPALVVSPVIDKLVDYRFSAGFWGAMHRLPKNQGIPIFDFSNSSQKKFAGWFRKHKPDVIITLHGIIREWLGTMGVNIPDEVGLAHLDRTPSLTDWAGMNQNSNLVGAAAVDLLVGQLHRSEFGTPEFTKCVLVESSWVDGATIGDKRNNPRGGVKKRAFIPAS